MKKVAALATIVSNFILVQIVRAAISIDLEPPPNSGINPSTDINIIFQNALRIVYVVAILAVLVYLILGAFGWITSGGDKEKVGQARGKIVNALIGLAILALAFIILVVVGEILNIKFLDTFTIPNLQDPLGPTPIPTKTP